jgi:hypothetical protein
MILRVEDPRLYKGCTRVVRNRPQLGPDLGRIGGFDPRTRPFRAPFSPQRDAAIAILKQSVGV